ncbi:hypothetical protein V8E51_004142 [Hyaloscypha variabilis]
MTDIYPFIGVAKECIYVKPKNNHSEAINKHNLHAFISSKHHNNNPYALTSSHIHLHHNMHSTIAVSLAVALASNVMAAPLQARQALSLADTVQFVAKTVGANPNPGVLPDINNWLFTPIHSGAGLNTATLVDPSKNSFNLSAPGFFQNGTDADHSTGGYLTAGYLDDSVNTPWSLVLDLIQDGSSNPGAYVGPVEFNVGVGTDGLEVFNGQLITSRYVTDSFWGCPNVEIEGDNATVVKATDRYADPPAGCWSIQLFAQCAGPISAVNKVAFPAFVQSGCYANATVAVVSQ